MPSPCESCKSLLLHLLARASFDGWPCCERGMTCTLPQVLPVGLSEQLLLQDLWWWYTRQSTARLSGTSWGMQQVGSHRNITLAPKLNTFYRTPAWNLASLWLSSCDFSLVLLKLCFQGAWLYFGLCCEQDIEFFQKTMKFRDILLTNSSCENSAYNISYSLALTTT